MNSTHPKWNPWPTGIVAFFVVFIGFIAAFITFASRQPAELVRPDYYAEELQYQQQIDRLNRTRAIRTEVGVAYEHAGHCIEIVLPAEHALQPTSGTIQLYRPSDSRLDRKVKLEVNHRGVQRMDARALSPGLWRVKVQWVSDGRGFYFDQALVVPKAS